MFHGHRERLREMSARREGDTVAHEAALRDARQRRNDGRRGRDAPEAKPFDAVANPAEVAVDPSGGRGA